MSKVKKSFPFVSGSSYNIKLLLIQESFDLGIFDTYEDSKSTAIGMTPVNKTVTITGTSINKLSRIRTYSQSTDLSKKYIVSTNSAVNGLDLTKTVVASEIETYVYYIDKITYTTVITSTTNRTTYSYNSIQSDPILFDNKPIIKDEKKMHQIEKSMIEPDVFIVRQDLPVLTDIYRLADLKNVDHLYRYGAGHFNIIDNI